MFIFKQHALEKMDSLGVERKEVEETVRRGMKWKEEKTEKWHAQMASIEVVFIKDNSDYYIITVHPAGREK